MRPCWCRFCRDCSRLLADPAATADLIAFLQALPERRKRGGVRYPQWLLLLMAILGILSGCRSARDLERFAKRHHQAFGSALFSGAHKAPMGPASGCFATSSHPAEALQRRRSEPASDCLLSAADGGHR